MHIVGRYERVRGLGPRGLTAPFILDRKAHRLRPYYNSEWHQTPDGVWLPAVYGGAGFSSTTQLTRVTLGPFGTSAGTLTGVALSSIYVYGVSGAAVGLRYQLPVAKTVANVYFYIVSYGGTAANVTTIAAEIRNSTSNLPGSTVHATQTKDPASATGWINCSGYSFAGSADTDYWASVANTGATAATDFPTVAARYSGVDLTSTIPHLAGKTAADSTNGWSTGTIRAEVGNVVVAFSDGSAIGDPFTAAAAGASNTERRGYVLDSFTENIKILGMLAGVASNNLSGLELYDAAGTTPGSGQAATGATQILGQASTIVGYEFETAPTLLKNALYRLVFTYSAAATTSPRKYQIGTGADANLRAAMIGSGGFYWAQANGTTSWSNDDQNAQPQAVVLVEDQVSIASGGSLDSGGILYLMRGEE